jgi:hypothetical protein
VEFIGVLWVGPSLSADGLNCSWIEFRDLCSVFNIEQVAVVESSLSLSWLMSRSRPSTSITSVRQSDNTWATSG